jgi:hypothetical protein
VRELLFDTPFWLYGVLAIVGAALWASGNARQEARLKWAGLAALAVAVLLAALSYFVETDKEAVARRMRELVATVESKDQKKAAELLHSRASLAGVMDKEAIVARVGTAADQFKLKDVKVTSMTVSQGAESLITTISVTAAVDTPAFSGNVPTNWQVTWEKVDRGWVAREITPVSGMATDATTLREKARGN